MYTKILLSAVIVTSSLSADLLIEAKKAGLKPIPTDKKELSKLIDNPKNPISEKKLSSERNYISTLDSQRAVL